MVDFLSPSDRSERMSRIRGKDTQPEIALHKALHRMLDLKYFVTFYVKIRRTPANLEVGNVWPCTDRGLEAQSGCRGMGDVACWR